MTPLLTPPPALQAPETSADRRLHLTALTQVYVRAGLPLSAAIEAAIADCRIFGGALPQSLRKPAGPRLPLTVE